MTAEGLAVLARITADMARELAISQRVCVRPIMRRVDDRDTGHTSRVAIPCGSTRETVCPPCAHKARVLRMQQCTEGWHRASEPEVPSSSGDDGPLGDGHHHDDADQDDDQDADEGQGRRVRSTKRREDATQLPRRAVEDRTIGQVFIAPDGQEYRPSMFLTLTLPSYGRVANGVPIDPGSYDYRRAALDAVHFPKLVDRFWQNLRRCAGFKVQYFASIEPQHRLAPHLHAAIRGAIPRQVLRQVIRATYVQVWWPAFDRAVYVDRLPVWVEDAGYVDPQTGECLPTWAEALDQTLADDTAEPVHVMRFGSQYDMRGIIAPSAEADRAVRYLTKYLTKAICDPLNASAGDELPADPAREAHIDRLVRELRFLPCSPRCANWLRYGIQPEHSSPGMIPGACRLKGHDREHLGLGGRRVLVSRQWSGKTVQEHRADRATVVREALLSAGIVAPEVERMAADVVSADGLPRFIWTDEHVHPDQYARIILESIAERQRWRAQYEAARDARDGPESVSATDNQPP